MQLVHLNILHFINVNSWKRHIKFNVPCRVAEKLIILCWKRLKFWSPFPFSVRSIIYKKFDAGHAFECEKRFFSLCPIFTQDFREIANEKGNGVSTSKFNLTLLEAVTVNLAMKRLSGYQPTVTERKMKYFCFKLILLWS